MRNFIKTTLNGYISEQNISKLNDNFWNWFGDSIVLDEKSNPLICYHGTDSEFNEFKISKYGSNGAGIYLTPYKEIAELSGKYIMPVYVRIEDSTDGIIAGYEIVVKKPQNIKSINNDGSWDLDDKNIYS